MPMKPPNNPDWVECPSCDEDPGSWQIENLASEFPPEATVNCHNPDCCIREVTYLVDSF